jgi:hypothetical protein
MESMMIDRMAEAWSGEIDATSHHDRRRRAFLNPEAFGTGKDRRHLSRTPLAQLAPFGDGRWGEDESYQGDADAAHPCE